MDNDQYLPEQVHSAGAELQEWITRHHQGLTADIVAKAIEYGSLDLEIMGDTLRHSFPATNLSKQQALQSAIAFYALGKVARVMSALQEGRDPGIDSWLDLEVYALMAQRVADRGKWI